MIFFSRKIFSSHNNAFGVDISDLSIKVVEIRENGKGMVVSGFGSAPMVSGSVVDGEIVRPEVVVATLQKAIESSQPKRIRNKKVFCALPETRAFLRIINIPTMKSEEIQEAIKWEVEANIPLTLDQVYYDWQVLDVPIGRESGKISVLVVAVARKVVDQFIEVVELAGLQPVGMEIESIAQSRSLAVEKSNTAASIIVDLGDRRTSFLMLIGNVPCFTSSIPLSGQSMTDAIAKMISVSYDEAERLKRKFGIGSFIKQDPIFRSVEPILENLVAEIEKSIDFFVSGLKYADHVDRVILCGGGARAKGIIPYLSSRLGREVELGDPWVNFGLAGKLPMIDREVSVQYSTAIGLALRGLNFYENIS